MDAAAQAIARRAANRLSAAYGASVAPMVERALMSPDAVTERYAGLDRAIAIAALVVSLAQLAWQIRQDLAPIAPAPAALARELRIRIELPGGLTVEDRDRVISVIVEEATKPQQL